MSELTGKVALVTGASGGIGSATARLLNQRGARLVLSDLQDEGPAELMRELGDDARWCRCDVAQEADNAAMVQCALDSFGRIDIAVLNAGIEGRAGLMPQIEATIAQPSPPQLHILVLRACIAGGAPVHPG